MKRVIYKFGVSAALEQAIDKGAREGCFELQMPAGAKVLCVQSQKGDPQIWALCDKKADLEARKFLVVGTGLEFDPRGYSYVGTFQVHGGELVFHLFEWVGAAR
jgi:hypothetical protein